MIKGRFKKQLRSGKEQFLLELEFDVPDRSFCAIYGPSGAGKSSLLRMLAGFMAADEGYVSVGDTVWFDTSKRIDLPPGQREVAMVFQEDALFPNMRVAENIRFALPAKETAQQAEDLLRDFGLQDLKERYPASLSGGQKQRASLARAIAQRPKVLLLDEPLNALDRDRREDLQDLLEKVHQRYKLTTFLVTHDLREVFRLADMVLHLEAGSIRHSGSPEALVHGKDINYTPVLQGIVVAVHQQPEPRVKVLIDDAVLTLPFNPDTTGTLHPGQRLRLGLTAQGQSLEVLR